jgi:hypothetical protein
VLAFSLFLSIFFEATLPAAVYDVKTRATFVTNASLLSRTKTWWLGVSRNSCFLLFLGGVAHLFLDTFMWPFGAGLMWLYPINDAWFKWSFGAWWPGTFDGIAWLAPFFAAAVLVEILLAIRARRVPVQG